MARLVWVPFKPDDHSELVPLLPIPNRTVKRLSADDSAGSRVKVGHRQATSSEKKPLLRQGLLLLWMVSSECELSACLSCEASRLPIASCRPPGEQSEKFAQDA